MCIRLIDIVSDTYTNASGYTFYSELKRLLSKGEQIQVSFLGAPAPSSSFLNSSFGALIEEMGLERFLKLVKPSDVTPTQASMLKHYIQGFRSGARA
ncbi:STAS-like domain-containing protein [Algoriphagus sediminis]|uniref:STAS-like domain-containing protein n=1 Tax=Algoriphagus sediminis TaxID=3057113 RepID=A0ABT7YDG1_9BACT|nr:STAS-like domain-containing protein [Algoriphagus sediminis]MDN3204573.1 STAS-like domain-containing protein [Algoriphagus sediminis]